MSVRSALVAHVVKRLSVVYSMRSFWFLIGETSKPESFQYFSRPEDQVSTLVRALLYREFGKPSETARKNEQRFTQNSPGVIVHLEEHS